MVEHRPSKPAMWVRFPSLAPFFYVIMKRIVEAYNYAQVYLSKGLCPFDKEEYYRRFADVIKRFVEIRDLPSEKNLKIKFNENADERVLEIVFRNKISMYLKSFLNSTSVKKLKENDLKEIINSSDYFLTA